MIYCRLLSVVYSFPRRRFFSLSLSFRCLLFKGLSLSLSCVRSFFGLIVSGSGARLSLSFLHLLPSLVALYIGDFYRGKHHHQTKAALKRDANLRLRLWPLIVRRQCTTEKSQQGQTHKKRSSRKNRSKMQKKQGKKEKEEVLVLIATVVAVVTLTRLITPALLLPAERSVMSPSLFFLSVASVWILSRASPLASQQQNNNNISFLFRFSYGLPIFRHFPRQLFTHQPFI